VLDHADQIGAKILISGGGRCNFTNLLSSPDRYHSENPSFCISALKNYTANDFIRIVDKHKISYHEKTLGQLFCDVSAREIVTMLINECNSSHVKINLSQKVVNISKNDYFQIKTEGETILSSALVIATGGLSIPKIGATGLAYQIAQQFDLPLTEIRPGLVPLTFSGNDLELMRSLSGVSLEIVATCGRSSFREGMVFTHRGLSGPAILQISSIWHQGLSLILDLAPDKNVEAFLVERKRSRPKAEIKTVLSEILPQRLAQAITISLIPNKVIGTMTDKALKECAGVVKSWRLTPTGSEGYAKAEVTLGGLDTSALSSKTMQVTSVRGLYFIGEAVDVTGWLGGYNFQWAWSSGWAAGSAL